MKYRQFSYAEPQEYVYKVKDFAGIDGGTCEEDLPFNYASYAYNVRFSAGKVSKGWGVCRAKKGTADIPDTPSPVKKIFNFRKFDVTTQTENNTFVFLGQNKKLYKLSDGGASFSEIGHQFNNLSVTFLNCTYQGRDCLWACDSTGDMIVFDGDSLHVYSDRPYITSACVYHDRVYATTGIASNVLKRSGTDAPDDWTDTYSVSFTGEGGKINRIVLFKEGLYIIREYAVHKFVAYRGSDAYTESKVFSGNGYIYADSVAVCENKLYMATDNGIYQTDGTGFSKVFQHVFPLIDGLSGCTGCAYRGKYYLACKMKTEGETVGDETNAFVNNAVFALDEDEKNVCIFRGGDVAEFLPYERKDESRLYMRMGSGYKPNTVGMMTDAGSLFGTALEKKWRSPTTALSYLKEDKTLRKIFLHCSGGATLKVTLDKDYTFSLPASYGVQAVYVNKKGEAVGLTLTSTAENFLLTSMEMEFALTKRGIYDEP